MRKSSKSWSLIITLLIIGSAIFAYTKQQVIYDYFKLRNYHPPTVISQLASDTTMNPIARNIFYVEHPEVDDKASFNGHCRGNNEQTIVLGCYVPNRGVYVYDVKETKLTGIQQVTAAHEMLHAAYDRLSKKDKDNVGALIDQAYQQVNNARIKATIEQYRKAGADTTNELHSILGTEVRDLPPGLESYYKKYFIERKVIVRYSEKYEQVFTDNKNQVDQYDAQLSDLKKQIQSNEAELEGLNSSLEASRKQLDQELASKNYQAYNSGVPVYNSSVNNYNAEVGSTKQLIALYNQTLDQRNAIALESQQLYKAIDSRYDTQQNK
jgi:DNA repair ATPase RecN